MDPLTIAALIQAGALGVQGIKALHQKNMANKLGRTPRPDFQIPSAVTDANNLATAAYGKSMQYGLPGQGAIEAKMGNAQAGSLNTLMQSQYSPAAVAAGVAAVDQNSKNAVANLGVQAANYQAGNMRNSLNTLLNQKRLLAAYQDKQFQWDKAQPYLAAIKAANMFNKSASMNFDNMIRGASALGSQYALRGGFNEKPNIGGGGFFMGDGSTGTW